MKDTKYFNCVCEAETLRVTKYGEEDFNEVLLSMYSFGEYNKKPNIFSRIKYCLRHLKTGRYYADQLIMSKETSKELGKFLLK